MPPLVVLLLNYFHDLAVAMLAANVVVIHLCGRIMGEEAGQRAVLDRLTRTLSRLTMWILVYVLAAGGVRARYFMAYEYNPLVSRQGMVTALVVKHIVLIGLTVFGILGMRRVRRRLRTSD